AAILLAAAFNCFAQTQPVSERRVIEVSGSAEQWITPDTFTFKITVIERMEKKEKVTIEQQEALLRSELSKIGVDPAKSLSVYDINSTYFPQKKVRDVLSRKDYRLKLTDIKHISPLVDLIDRLNIGRLSLEDTEHSEITRFREETKIEAIKAAKHKAAYLLSAIGERPGKAVYVKEIPDDSPRMAVYGLTSGLMSNSINTRVASGNNNDEPDLSFSQIRLRYVIEAKFEIE
ncbi:MAG: SIMPL domain-containing protein, partial [Acidobacteria bacterium]|nr:SIMPL domain-containing protein [Acidobacteriota bacterium]